MIRQRIYIFNIPVLTLPLLIESEGLFAIFVVQPFTGTRAIYNAKRVPSYYINYTMHRKKVIRTYMLLLAGGMLLTGLSRAQEKPYKGGSGAFKKLVWQDEFTGAGLPDTTKWAYEVGLVRNRELQYYTYRRSENAVVQGGHLAITARNDSLPADDTIYPITSASITTRAKAAWTYGRIEVRAKIPASLGSWPAIWMIGSDIDKVDWPACGEIDILEHVGYDPDRVHFNVHMNKRHQKNNGGDIYSKSIRYKAPYRRYHVYALEWFPDHMDWYMDKQKVFTYRNDGSGTDAWPFDQPQFLILNLAFGGAWGGTKGVAVSSLPQTLLVDYVRVYQ